MHKFRAPRVCLPLLRSSSPAAYLAWVGGCALLLWTTHASAWQVSLAWDPVNAPTVAGYRIYYSLTRSTYTAYIDVGLATTATVTGLTAGQTYYFVATAYDATGNESGPSNTVTVSLPSAVPSAPMLVLSVNT